jgi:hypothetical protein
MKNDAYALRIVFDSRGKYFSAPGSCGCPAGNGECSHLLGYFAFIYLVQTYPHYTWHDLLRFLPEPVRKVHSVPIPWTYAFPLHGSALRRSAREKKRKQITAAVGTDGQDDSESPLEKNEEKIDLFARADAFVAECLSVAADEQGAGAKPEGIVTTKAIKAETDRYIHERSLPRNPNDQRRVDLRHEKLHLAYECGVLQKNILSYYIAFHTTERRARLELPLPPTPAARAAHDDDREGSHDSDGASVDSDDDTNSEAD